MERLDQDLTARESQSWHLNLGLTAKPVLSEGKVLGVWILDPAGLGAWSLALEPMHVGMVLSLP